MKWVLRILGFVALLVATVAVFPAPVEATADPLIITTSTTLNADHSGSIVIGADSITLDCAGFSVDGSLSGSGTGISLDGRMGVTVKNCHVTDFPFGFELFDSSDNTFEQNTANGNDVDGILLEESSNNTFKQNTANGNGGVGFVLLDSIGNTFEENTANGNGDAGFFLEEASDRNTFKENTANNNDFAGFTLELPSGNTFEENTANGNEFGFFLENADNNTFKENTASGNSEFGAAQDGDSTGNVFEENQFSNTSGGI